MASTVWVDDAVHRRAAQLGARPARVAVRALPAAGPVAARRRSCRTRLGSTASIRDVSRAPAWLPISGPDSRGSAGGPARLRCSPRSRRRSRARGWAAGPGAVQATRHRGLSRLVPAAVAEEDDVAEPLHGEAPGRGLENALEDRLRDRDRPRVAHVPRRRREPALRDVGEHGATSVPPSARAIAVESAFTRTLCLPIAMCGPFCSVPPVGTMIVVVPARIRSRTSVQVSSSRMTVAGVSARLPDGDEGPPHQKQDRACSHHTPSRAPADWRHGRTCLRRYQGARAFGASVPAHVGVDRGNAAIGAPATAGDGAGDHAEVVGRRDRRGAVGQARGGETRGRLEGPPMADDALPQDDVDRREAPPRRVGHGQPVLGSGLAREVVRGSRAGTARGGEAALAPKGAEPLQDREDDLLRAALGQLVEIGRRRCGSRTACRYNAWWAARSR